MCRTVEFSSSMRQVVSIPEDAIDELDEDGGLAILPLLPGPLTPSDDRPPPPAFVAKLRTCCVPSVLPAPEPSPTHPDILLWPEGIQYCQAIPETPNAQGAVVLQAGIHYVHLLTRRHPAQGLSQELDRIAATPGLYRLTLLRGGQQWTPRHAIATATEIRPDGFFMRHPHSFSTAPRLCECFSIRRRILLHKALLLRAISTSTKDILSTLHIDTHTPSDTKTFLVAYALFCAVERIRAVLHHTAAWITWWGIDGSQRPAPRRPARAINGDLHLLLKDRSPKALATATSIHEVLLKRSRCLTPNERDVVDQLRRRGLEQIERTLQRMDRDTNEKCRIRRDINILERDPSAWWSLRIQPSESGATPAQPPRAGEEVPSTTPTPPFYYSLIHELTLLPDPAVVEAGLSLLWESERYIPFVEKPDPMGPSIEHPAPSTPIAHAPNPSHPSTPTVIPTAGLFQP